MPKKEYVEAFSPEEALAAVPDALRPVARVIYGPELEAYYVYTILGYEPDAKDTRLFAQRLLLGFVREGQWVPSRSYDIFCEQAWQRQAEQQAEQQATQQAEPQAEAQEAQAEPTAAQAVTPDDIELPCFPDEVNAVSAEEVSAAAQELAVARSHAEQQQAKLAATLEVNAQLKQRLAELEAQLKA